MNRDARIGAARRLLRKKRDEWIDAGTYWANNFDVKCSGGPEHLAAKRGKRLIKLELFDPTTWGRYPTRGALP